MEFKDQIDKLQLYVDYTPRVYVKWVNMEPGYDKTDCYERITLSGGSMIVFVNTNNRSSSVCKGTPFFQTLEDLYQKALTKYQKDQILDQKKYIKQVEYTEALNVKHVRTQ